MGSRALVAALAVLAASATVPPPAHAGGEHRTHLPWTNGTFILGLDGRGNETWPGQLPAPDHARIPFEVDACYRSLSPGLLYEPKGAFVHAERNGTEVAAGFPFIVNLTLLDADGDHLANTTVKTPDRSIGGPTLPFHTVEEAGRYTILLELLEGAAVDWQLRVRGFPVDDDPARTG